MSAATLDVQKDSDDIPCPYTEGAKFTLEITRPEALALQARVRVVKAFEPFTMSPVMRVALEEGTSPFGAIPAEFGLPTDLVLKVYDHRFARSARRRWKLKPYTPEHEAEYMAYANSPHAPRTLDEMFGDGDEDDADTEDTSFEDDTPEYIHNEHYVALAIASYFPAEYNAYERLASLQGKDIPIFYGTTRFLGGEGTPNLNLSKPGILLQYTEGTDLESIEPGQANIDFLARECLRIIEAYSQLGVLNLDVHLGKFIVRPDGLGVVMIDFANSRLRLDGMSDKEWKTDKWYCDEEGDFGNRAQIRWNWKFEHSYRWLVEA